MCCVRTRQHPLPVWSHNLSLTNLLISPSILNHIRWELYQVPPRHLQTSGWTHHKGRINHKISHLMCLFIPDGSDNTPPMSIINFDDLLGRTFLLPMDENGERKRATISEHVKELYQQQVSREDQLRFKLKIDGDQLDDLISYNQLMEYLEDKTDTGPLEDGLYRFTCIKDHKGPYTSSDPEYNGSSYNLLIEWETGEQTWEPLSNIIASDP